MLFCLIGRVIFCQRYEFNSILIRFCPHPIFSGGLGGAWCRLSQVGVGSRASRRWLVYLSRAKSSPGRTNFLLPSLVKCPLRDKHGKRMINAPPSAHRHFTFCGVEYRFPPVQFWRCRRCFTSC